MTNNGQTVFVGVAEGGQIVGALRGLAVDLCDEDEGDVVDDDDVDVEVDIFESKEADHLVCKLRFDSECGVFISGG